MIYTNIELTILISIITVCCTVYGVSRNIRIDTQSAEKDHTTVLIKLENIQTGVSEIKADIRGVKEDVKDLEKRMAKVEESAKQAHKRLDEMKGETIK